MKVKPHFQLKRAAPIAYLIVYLKEKFLMASEALPLSLFASIILALTLGTVVSVSYTQAGEMIWSAWETKDVTLLSDDGTDSTFALSTEVLSASGNPTLQVTPGGSADETKLAFSVSGADLQDWANYEQIQLNIYLPEANTLNPNQFFLGMANVTGNWAWVDGVFGLTQGVSGWIQVTFTPSSAMRHPNREGSYVIFFSFFNENAQGKQPLTEPFYLGSITLTTLVIDSVVDAADSAYQAEVDGLLAMDDAELVDAVARATFDYFWDEANPENGLIKDRSTVDSPASIAAVGFGLSALTVAVDRDWISYDAAYERALITLQTFASGFVPGEHGFFYHFINMETGERVWDSELSSIDTALFIAGALSAGQYFADTEVTRLAQQLYENVDWQWMMGGSFISMGWKPDVGFFDSTWDHFDESIILYVLAIASPTHPVPAEAWENWRRPVNREGEYIYLPGEPLFVYQYPLVWLDLRNREDAFANYFNNTILACERNREYSEDHAEAFTTYQNGVWGISASDGPEGYRAYGAADGNHDGTVSPYTSIACLPFTPEASLTSMRAMLTQYGSRVWREYGYVSAINALVNWYSDEHIGIDQGDLLLMIVNYQDGFLWDLMSQNEYIQNGLSAMGFVESTGDYAVTPAYLAEVQGR